MSSNRILQHTHYFCYKPKDKTDEPLLKSARDCDTRVTLVVRVILANLTFLSFLQNLYLELIRKTRQQFKKSEKK